MVTKEKIIKQYLLSLETADYEVIINLFTSDAMIESPLYGSIRASQFYKDLFQDTHSSKITLKNIFISLTNEHAAAQFEYIWILKEGKKIIFEVVDLFEFDLSNKIKKLIIIYDTYKIRSQISPFEFRNS